MLVSGYRILEEIGHGGMATVYLAIQESLNRQVALKVLTHTTHPGFSERFLREARVVASLNHRHVVTIYDVGVDQERHYISMEYLTGGDLRKWIARGVPMSTALRIVDNIASALQAGHEKGIVHRDVKPANILFRDDGTPLLSDFGVAKQSDATTLQTKTGMILGTPAYLSPEQAHGTPLDGRADMYSLGIVLYEMLTGTRPYEGDSDISTIFKHAYDPLPMLPGEYDYLQSFLSKVLAKQPEDRFRDMAAMRTALREVVRSGRSTRRPSEAAASPAGSDSDNQSRLAHARQLLLSYRGAAVLSGLVVSATLVLVIYPGPRDEAKGERSLPLRTEDQLSSPSELVSSVETEAVGVGVDRKDSANPDPGSRVDDLITTGREQVAEDQAIRPSEIPGPVQTEDVRVDSEVNQRAALNVKPRVDDLIEVGNERLAEYKTISPKDDSALYYFRLAESLDPGNPDAQEGLYQVASHYAVLADQQIQERHYVQARQFIDRGLRISPGHPRLRALDRKLQLHSVSRNVKRASENVLESLGNVADEVVEKIKERTDRR